MSRQDRAYCVLARRYRPTRLSDLVGQEIMVKTMLQAVADKRLPHAILLHGTRGVGKTTTARILAKILNCLGNDNATQEPCGACNSCVAIAEGRFLDVVEMDAASHTGVDDIREIIESSRYRAVVGHCKVYIIDEVHMLSKSAFNALLKTLEEPPPNVLFILATTELRRVPETILSRCMRFELRRMEMPTLIAYLQVIAEREAVIIEAAATQLIAQAADGSMRDALSLLDQAIALTEGPIAAETVRAMLGLAKREALLNLLQEILRGAAAEALAVIAELIQQGSDPVFITEGLLEVVYHLTVIKTTPQAVPKLLWDAKELAQAQTICATVDLSVLMQSWQVLSRGYEEVSRSTMPSQALEMLLIRLAYLSPLPSAHDLLGALQEKKLPIGVTLPATPAISPPSSLPEKFEDVISILKQAREVMLYSHLVQDVALVSYKPGEMHLRASTVVPNTFGQQLSQVLEKHTQQPWVVNVMTDGGGVVSLAQQLKQRQAEAAQESRDHPAVQAVLDAFPGASATIQHIGKLEI